MGSAISAAILVIALAMVLATVTMAEIIAVMVTTASWIRAVLIILTITGSLAACTQAIPIIIIIIITAFMAGFTRPTFTATFSHPQRAWTASRAEPQHISRPTRSCAGAYWKLGCRRPGRRPLPDAMNRLNR